MLDKAYDAQKYERDIYAQWENAGVFKPKAGKVGTHVNILPPPNANGALHLGHASGYSIMDIAGRFARMQGKETLLLPGKDHAGILTQTVFEKQLLEEGKNRHDLGREEFYKQCYDFCIESSEIMRSQEKRMGLSADWDREKFTLDPEISKEVLNTFVDMAEKGIAHKGDRIINWCPHCQTALSDMEVEHEDQTAQFYWIKYGPFTLATARPETKLGDTAVAVHPDDERYKDMVGKKYMIPGVLGEFEITVIADEAVDPEFGTGAVKVTPAHSFVDYEMAQRHGIESKMIINKEGRMMDNCGKYAGMTTKECRKAIVEDMKAMGLIEKIDENYQNKISVHDRCGNIVEPLISEQWWVDTNHPTFSLKKAAIDAVKSGKIEIVPKHFEKTFFHWMDNLQPWCISRQLWWGHQIPAWYKDGEMKVQTECPGEGWIQDEDTFDTWFSSGQWAHNTVNTFGEDQYFPGDFMVMGRDILFFWACRMIMMSLYNSNGQEVPFKTLYLTGLITDRHGKKMSKSKGNGIDPLEMADKYGTDALRLSLFIGSSAGNDMRLYEEKIEGFRNFVNKLWNASRFVQMSLENTTPDASQNLSEADKWILSRTNKLVTEVTQALESYHYSEAGQKLYDFTWNEFCDWYLELSKGDKQNAFVLTEVLKTLLTLLHPFTPFVTEVLWEELGFKEDQLLAEAEWPQANSDWNHPEAETQIDLLVELVTGIRSLRAESKVDPVKKITGVVVAKAAHKAFFEDNAEEIKKLARFEELEITENFESEEQTVTQVISHGIEIHLPLAGMVDLAQEKARLEKELAETEKQLANLDGRLANEKYVNSAPAHLVEQTRAQRTETAEKLEKLKEQISKM